MLKRYNIKHFKLPALQQAVSYKHLHNQVERCGLDKRTCDTVVQSAVLVAVCRNAAKRDTYIILTSPEVSFQDFSMQLKNGRKHHSGYLPIVNGNTTFIADQSNSDMLQNSSDLYNGNIARMVTTITDPNSRAVLPLGNAYSYDQLNRLQKAVSFDQLNGNAWASGAPAKYQNSFTYDANGNILTQTRNDDNNQVIDELAYFYPKNAANNTVRNRLLYVSDNVDYDASDIDPGMTANNYAYDEEGRLIQDLQEEIASIEWRVDGKVKRINRIANSTKQKLSFDYDAMGHRIAKHLYTSANVLEKSTYYVLDAKGNTMATYERAVDENTQQISFAQTEKFIYGSSRLGVQNCNTNLLGSAGTTTYSQITVPHRIGKKGYELSNHLGNVLSVISDKVIPHSNGANVDYWLADILQSTDYSPFGVQLSGRNLKLSGNNVPYVYGFNGMEADDEMKGDGNSYDFGERMFDTRLGRWLTIDAFYTKYPSMSPYSFAGNSPISFVDHGGDSIYLVINGVAYNVAKHQTAWGSQEIKDMAYFTLKSTEEGQRILDKYKNSNQTNVYIAISDVADENTEDNSFSQAHTSQFAVRDESGKMLNEDPPKGTPLPSSGDHDVFAGVSTKSTGSAFMIVINKDYLTGALTNGVKPDRYTIAAVLYHEMRAHIEMSNAVNAEVEKRMQALPVAERTAEKRGELTDLVSHEKYGSYGSPSPTSDSTNFTVSNGSARWAKPAWTIFKQLHKLRNSNIEKSQQSSSTNNGG